MRLAREAAMSASPSQKDLFVQEKKQEYGEVYERVERHFETGKLAKRFEKVQALIDLQNGAIAEEKASALGADLSLRENPQIAVDNLMEAIYQDENKENYYMLLSFLEHRGKNALFSKVKNNDSLVAFMVPSGSYFSIKALNDKYLDPQLTDSVIVKRKELLQKHFGERLQVLEQEFKQSFFLAKEGVDVESEEFQKWMNEEMRSVEIEMDQYLLELLENHRATLNGDADKQQAEDIKLLQTKLNQALMSLGDNQKLDQESSYKITYGISKVTAKGENDLARAAVLAESKAIQSAQQNRNNKENYGSSFDVIKVKENIKRIDEIQAELLQVNKIEVPGEFTFFLFRQVQDPATGNFYNELNKDVWTYLRKGKFKEDSLSPAGKRVLELLKEYKEVINSIDYFKPNLAEEIEDGSVVEKIMLRKNLADKIREKGKLDLADFSELQEVLTKDLKDPNFTSTGMFHYNAIHIPNCSYISLDVLGLGTHLLSGYERDFSRMKNTAEEDWDEIFFRLGDDITKRMREIRAIALEVLREHGVEEVNTEVGGDELIFALSNDLVSDELLIDLKKRTNSRVVNTVVAEYNKDIDGDNDENVLLLQHIIALGKCETEINKIKAIEQQVDRLRFMVQQSNSMYVDYTDPKALEQSIIYVAKKLEAFMSNPGLALPDLSTSIIRQADNNDTYVLMSEANKDNDHYSSINPDIFLNVFETLLASQKQVWVNHINNNK